MSGEPEDTDLLAAEYALGCLDGAEMRAVEELAASDVALRRSIQDWVARLAPLATAVRPVAPPPELWTRLAATVGDSALAFPVLPAAAPPQPVRPAATPVAPLAPVAIPAPAFGGAPHAAFPPRAVPPAAPRDDGATGNLLPDNVMPLRAPRQEQRAVPPWHNIGFWRATTVAALAVAAALAGIMITRAPPVESGGYVAALNAPNVPAPAFLARSQPDGAIQVVAVNAPPAVPGRDMELWALPVGAAAPRSLGVMPASGKRVAAAELPRDGTQLMISLEPSGGSPSGLPTGPVLFSGKLASLN